MKDKAILVIDMPECCLDCPCSYTYANVRGTITQDICEATEDRRLSEENMNKEKPTWCPLKTLPTLKVERVELISKLGASTREVQCYAHGYTDCMEDMLSNTIESDE